MRCCEANTIAFSPLEVMDSDDLLVVTRELALRASTVEADLISHLGEIDARKLYRDRAFPSMFAYCLCELGFSEDVAYNRIAVARMGRRWPAVLDALRARRVHVAGLRLLEPHLTDENHEEVLEQADGKSKRQIEELVARLAPRPPVPTVIRQLPDPSAAEPDPAVAAAPATSAQRRAHRSVIVPLSESTFRIQFTGSRALRDKLRAAQDLLRHRIPDGDVAAVIEKALDLLIEKVKKERFAIVPRPRKKLEEASKTSRSRDIPAPIRRAVFERDRGRCTFVDETGRRCAETSGLEFDHIDGFARTRRHEVHRIRLLCRAHNNHAAEQMYGRAFMERARASRNEDLTRPGTGAGAGTRPSGYTGPEPTAREDPCTGPDLRTGPDRSPEPDTGAGPDPP